ncbi:alpha/beta hydrolase [Microbacterium resistens]
MTATPVIDRSAVRRAGRPGDAPLLVLLHGYGSDERDLLALASFLPEPLAVVSLPAPFAAPWPLPGRSWYPIEELERRDASSVTRAAASVLEWLDDEVQAAGTTAPVALLGFSQGASVALQALRLAPERIGAVVNLSGYATPGDLPRDDELRADRTPVFWGRGTHDDVIPPVLVEHTAQWLPDHAELTGRVYPGLTHSVSEQELADVHTFLTRWIDGLTPVS